MVYVIFSRGLNDLPKVELTLGPFQHVQQSADTDGNSIVAFNGEKPIPLAHFVEGGWRVSDDFVARPHLYPRVRFTCEPHPELPLPND